MPLTFYPFCSQQDKVTGKFRLRSDAGVRMYSHMARTFGATLVLPPREQCIDDVEGVEMLHTESQLLDNRLRKLDWDVRWLQSLLARVGDGPLVTTHETLPIPLRLLAPKLRIVVEGMRPPAEAEADLYKLAQRSANLVHCNSRQLAAEVDGNARVWPFGYEDSYEELRGCTRDIDVLFNARISAVDYTNFNMFREAMLGAPELSVRVTDPTGYGRMHGLVPDGWRCDALDEAAYRELLGRCRIVVSLVDNGYGGFAFREAIAAGCTPVCPRWQHYAEVVGATWQHYTPMSAKHLRVVVRNAAFVRCSIPLDVCRRFSYSTATEIARRDLEAL